MAVAKHRAAECGFLVLSMTGVLAEVHLPFAALEQAIARDDGATIKAVLKDAVPEFGSNAA